MVQIYSFDTTLDTAHSHTLAHSHTVSRAPSPERRAKHRPAMPAMALVPTAVLDHWHEKPLVVDISGADIAARSPPAATVLAGNSQQLQKLRSSPVFSPDRLDIAAAGAAREPPAPTVRFNERPVVLGFSPVSVVTTGSDQTESRAPVVAPVSPAPQRHTPSRAPSRAVMWMAAVTVQRAYRRRARRITIASERARQFSPPHQRSLTSGRVSVHTGVALSRQREARRAAALRATSRRQAEPEPSLPAAHSAPSDTVMRSSSCNTDRLTGCSSRTLVEAHFDSGPLGLRIAEYARPGCEGDLLRVEEIQPGSAAARISDLRVGMALLKINGADVRYCGHSARMESQGGSRSQWRVGKRRSSSSSNTETPQWFATVMERMAQRPLTLIFVADQSSARSTQSAPAPSTLMAMWQDSQLNQLTPMSAAEATTPPPPSPARPLDDQVENEAEGSVGASTPSDAYVPTRKNRPRKAASGCCAARPPDSRGS